MGSSFGGFLLSLIAGSSWLVLAVSQRFGFRVVWRPGRAHLQRWQAAMGGLQPLTVVLALPTTQLPRYPVYCEPVICFLYRGLLFPSCRCPFVDAAVENLSNPTCRLDVQAYISTHVYSMYSVRGIYKYIYIYIYIFIYLFMYIYI